MMARAAISPASVRYFSLFLSLFLNLLLAPPPAFFLVGGKGVHFPTFSLRLEASGVFFTERLIME